jgi:hypothetical protein
MWVDDMAKTMLCEISLKVIVASTFFGKIAGIKTPESPRTGLVLEVHLPYAMCLVTSVS